MSTKKDTRASSQIIQTRSYLLCVCARCEGSNAHAARYRAERAERMAPRGPDTNESHKKCTKGNRPHRARIRGICARPKIWQQLQKRRRCLFLHFALLIERETLSISCRAYARVSGRAGRRRFHSFLEANRIDKGQRHRKADSLHAANARGYSSSATVCKEPLCQYELCQVAIFFSDPSCHVLLLLGHCALWKLSRIIFMAVRAELYAIICLILDVLYGFFRVYSVIVEVAITQNY
jgi:hypothetical protein